MRRISLCLLKNPICAIVTSAEVVEGGHTGRYGLRIPGCVHQAEQACRSHAGGQQPLWPVRARSQSLQDRCFMQGPS